MKRIFFAVLLSLVLVGAGSRADALTTGLTEYAFNIDGAIYDSFFDTMPSTPGFDTSTGLGTITFTFGAGSHNVMAFFDHELNLATTGFFPEYGAANGTPASGLSWEIDEPGWFYGDIYNNFLAGTLDNSNGVPATAPDDVSMALGWNFLVDAGYTATLSFFLTDVAPAGGFFLTQTDLNGESIYAYSTLNITGGGTQPVPEPATMLLLGAGLGGVAVFRRRLKG